MMEHGQVREQLELAAVEPDGLDRLVAGDTAAASAIAGHLAGCPSCMDEFGRLRRAAALLRDVVATQPPPELRERTLSFVAAVGRPRGSASTVEIADATVESATGRPVGTARGRATRLVEPPPDALDAGRRRTMPLLRGVLSWLTAAAVLIAVVGITWAVARDDARRDQAHEVAALGRLTAWQLRVDARPDARRVVLTAPLGTGVPVDDAPVGSLLFSPSSREVVVIATGLEPPAAGREYRCWVIINGQRERLGRMYFSAEIAYWVGRVDLLDRVAEDSIFGVSLVEAAAPGVVTDPVIAGAL